MTNPRFYATGLDGSGIEKNTFFMSKSPLFVALNMYEDFLIRPKGVGSTPSTSYT